jgi:hypothetical protein
MAKSKLLELCVLFKSQDPQENIILLLVKIRQFLMHCQSAVGEKFEMAPC